MRVPLALNPRSTEPRYAIASALVELDRGGAALAELRRAAADRARDPEPWLRIASLELERAPAVALLAAERALRRDPHSGRALALRDQAGQLAAERATR